MESVPHEGSCSEALKSKEKKKKTVSVRGLAARAARSPVAAGKKMWGRGRTFNEGMGYSARKRNANLEGQVKMTMSSSHLLG